MVSQTHRFRYVHLTFLQLRERLGQGPDVLHGDLVNH